MQFKKIVTKCCVCGRERGDDYHTWHYRFGASEPDTVYTHGFCNVCYELEIMKLKLRNLEYAEIPCQI